MNFARRLLQSLMLRNHSARHVICLAAHATSQLWPAAPATNEASLGSAGAGGTSTCGRPSCEAGRWRQSGCGRFGAHLVAASTPNILIAPFPAFTAARCTNSHKPHLGEAEPAVQDESILVLRAARRGAAHRLAVLKWGRPVPRLGPAVRRAGGSAMYRWASRVQQHWHSRAATNRLDRVPASPPTANSLQFVKSASWATPQHTATARWAHLLRPRKMLCIFSPGLFSGLRQHETQCSYREQHLSLASQLQAAEAHRQGRSKGRVSTCAGRWRFMVHHRADSLVQSQASNSRTWCTSVARRQCSSLWHNSGCPGSTPCPGHQRCTICRRGQRAGLRVCFGGA